MAFFPNLSPPCPLALSIVFLHDGGIETAERPSYISNGTLVLSG